ncbi:hypothetical protein TNCT_369271 [Trichonephila clavata]|uniref:Integrase catalytic domain-containing protein n=1 Tax=Trichonephila clavata TaxID=2740835 RepID=A0A8X6JDB5_TRICU|nr:hypothetical protein TNCT_369271 [Trichonephila clavata]
MKGLCKKLYLGVPRSIIKKSEAKCKQVQPLKEKDEKKHIVASYPFERIQVECIDLSKYNLQNDGFKLIMTVVGVYSKFAFTYPLRTKTANEAKDCLQDLIYSKGAFKFFIQIIVWDLRI